MAFDFGKALSENLQSLTTGVDHTLGKGGLHDVLRDPVGKLKRGAGKGTLGHWVDQVYGGTFKDIMDNAQGKSDDDNTLDGVSAPTLAASEVDPEGELGALQDIRKKKQGRAAANLSPASGASILTS